MGTWWIRVAPLTVLVPIDPGVEAALVAEAALSRSGCVANPFRGRSSGQMGRLLQATARRVSVGLKRLAVRHCYGSYAPL
ncbi:hypothetical protein NDU88_003836 [Pleurodeles waltl]|uniref:Uncharacterized protein n=1 Tax=Pleurodeles waltl TaxID=8319 RepID=A0AAV7SH18_PLEWA|nr:hypothetical protein NDU88_003836 [Pleurodeles waltl]